MCVFLWARSCVCVGVCVCFYECAFPIRMVVCLIMSVISSVLSYKCVCTYIHLNMRELEGVCME